MRTEHARHLVTVWNPRYAADAMEAHLRMLLAVIFDGFASGARNPSAHADTVSHETILRWRNRLLGVGSEGVMGRLAKVRRR